jgi:UPF0271 protein
MAIDLNCDMGESFGAYKLGMDEEMMRHITSANVACGWHAGDPLVMDQTVKMAKAGGVGVGAHPGYPDLLGFGRRNLDCGFEELKSYVIYQVGALAAFCAANGIAMRHVKPHGQLYLTAVDNATVARAIAEAVVAVDKSLMYVALAGQKGELMTRVGQEVGLKVVYEAFPDRAYDDQGNLVSRKQAGAVIHDPQVVAARALKMAQEGRVVSVAGREISLTAQTLCLHGDNPSAVANAKTIRALLGKNGVAVRTMGG